MRADGHAPRKVLVLKVALGGKVLGEYAFDRDLVRIGRDPASEVRLGSDRVSRLHCRVVRTRDGFVVEDRGSRNGTSLNGRKVREDVLESGDLIVIEGYRLWVSLASSEEDQIFPPAEEPNAPTIPNR